MHAQESSQPATGQSIFVPTGDATQHVIHPFDAQADGELSLNVDDYVIVSEPLKASIRAASLEDARDLAHSCDRLRQEVETQIECKIDIQRELGLPVRPDCLLVKMNH
ncbi:hypothetical protein L1987_27449 [Smallanthus sonchifolius]|uniref:Uncharacterized protein n=1 Tax=Smallanthus sonchifolius TaxID=185202 RepID=A0ACB9ICP0_9ASTR|nr:hypothetical protein L1987_27449 [Smallanthus sonchifolius]